MEEIIPDYLYYPERIQSALNILEEKQHLGLPIFDLINIFDDALGLKSGETFPFTKGFISGTIYRARVNDLAFEKATSISQIGINFKNVSQGRANPIDLPIFYAADTKSTAAFEVLQDKAPGQYSVTIGSWTFDNELQFANLVDGSDPDFKKIPFAHSLPKEYLKDWPELPRKSTTLLVEYFTKKFKSRSHPGLYSITNVLSGILYSLQDVDGIGYGAVSDNFHGFNLALKDASKLRCTTVERWLINKIDSNTHIHKLIEAGTIDSEGNISW